MINLFSLFQKVGGLKHLSYRTIIYSQEYSHFFHCFDHYAMFLTCRLSIIDNPQLILLELF